MIEYINKRLNEWACWCKRRDDGGLGYPSQSNYCALLQIHGAASAGAITQFAAEEEIEVVMIRIRQAAPAQWDVASWFYLKGSFTVKRISQELRCDEATVYRRLHALHAAVMYGLQDLAIEAEDRKDIGRAVDSIATQARTHSDLPPVVVRRSASNKIAEFA